MSCCACFCAVLWIVVVWYLQKVNDIDFQKWDLDNLTCSDFTVEFEITEAMWANFMNAIHSHARLPLSGAAPNHIDAGLPVVTLEAFLEHDFTRKLNRAPKVIEDVEIRVANITFGFDNKALMLLLVERGALIAKGKFAKVPKVNEKIEELSKEKRAELIRPTAAFITFERQEGKDRALVLY